MFEFITNILDNNLRNNIDAKSKRDIALLAAKNYLYSQFGRKDIKLNLEEEELIIANSGFVLSLKTNDLYSSVETNGFLAWKYVFRLQEKIYTNKKENEYYNISQVTIYVDANSGEIMGYDCK